MCIKRGQKTTWPTIDLRAKKNIGEKHKIRWRLVNCTIGTGIGENEESTTQLKELWLGDLAFTQNVLTLLKRHLWGQHPVSHPSNGTPYRGIRQSLKHTHAEFWRLFGSNEGSQCFFLKRLRRVQRQTYQRRLVTSNSITGQLILSASKIKRYQGGGGLLLTFQCVGHSFWCCVALLSKSGIFLLVFWIS